MTQLTARQRQLVTDHLDYAAKQAEPLLRYALPGRAQQPADLLQEARYGLCQAAADYDPARGVEFTTFAFAYIRRAVFRAIEREGSLITCPRHRHAELQLLRLGRPDGDPLADTLADPAPADAEAQALEQERIGRLQAALHTLPARQRRLIKILFGIGCRQRNTQQAAQLLGISPDQVRRQRQQALNALALAMEE